MVVIMRPIIHNMNIACLTVPYFPWVSKSQIIFDYVGFLPPGHLGNRSVFRHIKTLMSYKV